MKMNDKCPQCGKPLILDQTPYLWLETYGNTCTAQAGCCGYGVLIHRQSVYTYDVYRGDRDQDDWGQPIKSGIKPQSTEQPVSQTPAYTPEEQSMELHRGDLATAIARRRGYYERTKALTPEHRKIALTAINDLAVDLAAALRFDDPNFSSVDWLAACGVCKPCHT